MAFTDLFQDYIDDPIDAKVDPLMQSYNQINIKKPSRSFLQTLRKAWREKNRFHKSMGCAFRKIR